MKLGCASSNIHWQVFRIASHVLRNLNYLLCSHVAGPAMIGFPSLTSLKLFGACQPVHLQSNTLRCLRSSCIISTTLKTNVLCHNPQDLQKLEVLDLLLRQDTFHHKCRIPSEVTHHTAQARFISLKTQDKAVDWVSLEGILSSVASRGTAVNLDWWCTESYMYASLRKVNVY